MRRDVLLLGSLFLVGFLVRAYAFGSIPGGMNQDEASTAYDAYAILHDGMDRNGIPYPAVLISWGSGMNALSAYAMVPFIAVFGLNPITARLPNFLSAIASLIIFYLLVKRVSGRSVAYAAAFLLVISPWHIMLARWGVDENLFPFVFLLGVYFLVRAEESDRWFVAACTAFGLALFAHGASYFTVPLFIAPATALLILHGRLRVRPLLLGWALLLLLALPHLLYLYVNHYGLNSIDTPLLTIPRLTGVPRYETVAAIFSGGGLHLAKENLLTFWHFLQAQNDGVLWNTSPQFGIIYLFSLPLAYLGLLHCVAKRWRLREFHAEQVMLLWLVVSIALAAVLSANVNRMNVLYFPLLFFVALAIDFLRTTKIVQYALIGAYCFSFLSFTHYYYTRYPAEIGPVFFESFGEAIQTASKMTKGTMCVSDAVNMPYIHVLFYNHVEPQVFRGSVVYNNPGAEFQSVRSFDRYIFGKPNCAGSDVSAYVLAKGEMEGMGLQAYRVYPFKNYDVAVRSEQLIGLRREN